MEGFIRKARPHYKPSATEMLNVNQERDTLVYLPQQKGRDIDDDRRLVVHHFVRICFTDVMPCLGHTAYKVVTSTPALIAPYVQSFDENAL